MRRRLASTAFAFVVGFGPATEAAVFTVDTHADGTDADPGDGLCRTSLGQCSLRAAVQEADARLGADRIELPHGIFRLGLGTLSIRTDVEIVGSGSGVTFIEAGTNHRVLSVEYDEVLVCGTNEVDRYDLFGHPHGKLVEASHGVTLVTNVTRAGTREELLVSGLSSGVHRYDARTGAPLGRIISSTHSLVIDANSGFIGQTEVLYVARGGFLGGVFMYEYATGALLGSGHGGGLTEASALLKDDGYAVASFETDAVLRFDAYARYEGVVASNGGLSGPTDVIRGPDGFLVASWYSNQVLAYDDNGAPTGARVTAGSGGLDGPAGLTITPTGELLVLSYRNNRILRYDADTGGYLGVFVDGAAAGISQIRCVAAVRGIGAGPTVSIDRVTIRGGRQNDDFGSGAGIFVGEGAEVRLTDTVVTDHESRVLGGAIRNQGTLSLLRTTVSDSRITQTQTGGGITASGGGIMNAGTLFLDRSTVHDNEATRGGGIANVGGTVTIVNSTISGNRADKRGGGILNILGTPNPGGVWMSYSTVTNNEANAFPSPSSNEPHSGGGIHNAGNMEIANSIVAGNDDHRGRFDAGYSPDCASPERMHSYGGNVIGVVTLDCDVEDVSNVGTPRDDVGSSMAPLDARLGPLASNGGATMTHAIAATSPAVDNMVWTATFPCPAYDQRGFTRRTSRRDRCDAGAYEVGAAPVFELPPTLPPPVIPPPWNTPIEP